MSVETQIFDFESVIPAAVVNAFTKGGFAANVYTAQIAPEFQRKRPRIECQYKHGGTEVPIRYTNDGTFRPTAFFGELVIAAITDVTPTGKTTHGEYRAKVRNFCFTLLPRVNNAIGGLTLHKINSMIESGSTFGTNPERGEEASFISFRVQFSIMNQAWSLLSAPQVDVST